MSCRLVPGQDPERSSRPSPPTWPRTRRAGVRAEVHADEARVPAYTIPADHPAIRAATAALEAVYPGQQVLLACIAGTLPATACSSGCSGVKTLFFSFSTADEKLHAPNEYLRIRRLREGMRAWEQLWRLLAAGPHRLAAASGRTARGQPDGLQTATPPTPTWPRARTSAGFELAPEFGRVPPYASRADRRQRRRSRRLLPTAW